MSTYDFKLGEKNYSLPTEFLKWNRQEDYSGGAKRLQLVYKFDNGLGLSVIYDGLLSYGRQKHLLEACVIEWLDEDDFLLNYDHNRKIKKDDLECRLDNSVFAFCTNEDVNKLIERVKELRA